MGSFLAILALALLQGVIIESVFIFCSGVTESDFLTHATFYAVYLLQDVMMVLILPNFSFLHLAVIVLLHAVLFFYTNALASSPSSELVDYLSTQCAPLVDSPIGSPFSSPPIGPANSPLSSSLFFRVFFNGLPKQPEAASEVAVAVGAEAGVAKSIEMAASPTEAEAKRADGSGAATDVSPIVEPRADMKEDSNGELKKESKSEPNIDSKSDPNAALTSESITDSKAAPRPVETKEPLDPQQPQDSNNRSVDESQPVRPDGA